MRIGRKEIEFFWIDRYTQGPYRSVNDRSQDNPNLKKHPSSTVMAMSTNELSDRTTDFDSPARNPTIFDGVSSMAAIGRLDDDRDGRLVSPRIADAGLPQGIKQF